MAGADLIVHGGPLLDGRAGTFRDGHAIVIRDGRVVDVVRAGSLPDGGETPSVDVHGAWITPGLIDSHCHLMVASTERPDHAHVADAMVEATATARALVEAGITTIRDTGSRTCAIHSLTRAVADGRLPGPRIHAAGVNVTGATAPRGWRQELADGPDEVRRLVREVHAAGAAIVKLVLSHAFAEERWVRVVRFLDDAEIAAAADEARSLGVRTGCHCEGLPAARAAVFSGLDVIDHGIGLDEELAAEMARRGTVLVPTLWAFSTATLRDYAGTLPAADAADYDARVAAVHRRSLRHAHAAGVTIAAGSDPMVVGFGPDVLVREAVALRDAGLSAAEVLRSLTANGATALGLDGEVGVLEPGARADVAVFREDPRDDLRALATPAFVFKDGVAVTAPGEPLGELSASSR